MTVEVESVDLDQVSELIFMEAITPQLFLPFMRFDNDFDYLIELPFKTITVSHDVVVGEKPKVNALKVISDLLEDDLLIICHSL